ncbi:flagellar basal body L-ring protein FlgH [Ideonella azotifigens]|uniref:Flagellar L-ring protein n=1 Tax=Ideonella azotifigens TaxID=513160 RepID=A0ABN1K6U4_9BURK|nr:flagellar basal body L-ring protein FlgH [Ideonella azotifigens]MCD2342165.1 flagellar basal body L-ring protein FlgH [Ideonella azotifigens]
MTLARSSLRSVALLALLSCGALAACSTVYTTPEVQFPTATAPAMPASGPTPWEAQMPVPVATRQAGMVNGSIYQAAAYRPMFEDHRARMVGDTLTVQISERVTASQKATSTIDKTGAVTGALSGLPLISPSLLAKVGVNAAGSSSNTFAGKGSTDTANDFSGTITAIVTGVLPNGHLLIAGEKQVGVNHNVDTLRFTGQVDPRSILPGNSIASTQIANVRVQHKGDGAMADTQGINWLSRFFLNLLPV